MSCYEWESGEIVLPTKSYTKFRQELIKEWNDWQLQLLEKAKIAVEILRKADEEVGYPVAVLSKEWQFKQLLEDELYIIINLIPHKDGKWMMPKKQDLKLKPISKGTTLVMDEASITLDDSRHLIIWHVSENNHACERAHYHPIAKKMFRMLSNVQWVRGTGGQIVGNDEYHQDNQDAGGGGNYVKQTFGLKGK